GVVLNDWSVESILQARSAPPVDVGTVDVTFPNISAGVRPDLVGNVPVYLYGPQYPGGKALNAAAFKDPPTDASGNPLRQGTVGRNAFRGFGATQWDFATHREFPIRESVRLEFRAEMFNIVNHPNFGAVFSAFSVPADPQFGQATQMLGTSLGRGGNLGGLNPLYQIGGPRSVQFGLKLQF
ncbi:MAG TPA: hypothetical protein VHM88_03810, partial [Candidatus Acidoferrales bacterium]|nr:hypothetical protein [Candidatus Acidoferrales bacterium]